MNKRYRIYYWTIGLQTVWAKYELASTWSEAEDISRRLRLIGRRTRIEAV